MGWKLFQLPVVLPGFGTEITVAGGDCLVGDACSVELLKPCITFEAAVLQNISGRQYLSCQTTLSAAPINCRLNVVVRSPTPFGLGRNGCWPSRGSQLPRPLPFNFSLCCPLNDHRRTAHNFLKIARLLSVFLFFGPSLSPHSSPSPDER